MVLQSNIYVIVIKCTLENIEELLVFINCHVRIGVNQGILEVFLKYL